MRKPTPVPVLFAWHIKAMQGGRPSVIEDFAECGWFKMRIVKDGPWVPVAIIPVQDIDEDGQLTEPEGIRCLQGRSRKQVPQNFVWPTCARHPISREEYQSMMAADMGHMDATHVPVDLSRKAVRP